ncbi:glycosyltransferase involved in cell wall biosynthesis [Hamadaea flava]|uniref:Glycosyltransferase family 2 protein n=1 Tax=Hamadaea flava TaxID=1742688 RepID=A0ABV8LM23_9ACTN|nr:glycosyltransferase family 2 protein [Hamadaea flava]MCP2324079.1 glycosyltransferase involved in cell wall biosynthesis [Hamadaea flava]
MPPLVSVIVPCHNSRKTLALCVEAAQAQTYAEIEVIVVDDASTDDSAAIAESLGAAVVRLPVNGGAGLARNRGMAAARGEVLFFVDSDVALAPDAVEQAMRMFDDHPEYAAVWGVYGDRPLVDDGIVERVQVLTGHYRQSELDVVHTGHFAVGALRRVVVDRIGGFDERLVGQWTNEDHEFGLRIAENFPVGRAVRVVGFHDDDDRVTSVVRKRFGRAVSLIPLVLKQRDLKPEREALHRPAELAAIGLTGFGLLLALVSPALGVLAVAAFGAFLWTVRGMLGFVRRSAGWPTAAAAAGLTFLYGFAVGLGGLTGALRYAVDPGFRRRYRTVSM